MSTATSKKLWRVNDQELQYVKEAIDSGLTGSMTKIFEAKFAEKFEVEYAIAVNSGTSALHAALGALEIQPGDEVIVPPLTFAATAFCVLYMGAVPIFADVEANTFNIDPQSIRSKITSKTKAIITVSLYGLMPAMDDIMSIAREHSLKVVEDNAQCVFGRLNSELAGSFGDISIYSFQRSKHLTMGDGGMVATNDERLAERVRKFADLGYRTLTARPMSNENFKDQIQKPDFKRHEFVGFNFRMPEVCAAMGLAQLDKLDMLIDRRQKIGAMYQEAVKDCDWIIPQSTPNNVKHSYWAFVFKFEGERVNVSWDAFRESFLKKGGEPFYGAWSLTYLEPALEGQSFKEHSIEYKQGLCPVAESLQPKLMQLKTNFEDLEYAKQQADILRRTTVEFTDR